MKKNDFFWNRVPCLFFVLFFVFQQAVVFGQGTMGATAKIRGHINNNEAVQARTELELQLKKIRESKNFDSIAKYPILIGKATLLDNDNATAIKKVNGFLSELSALGVKKSLLLEAHRNADDFFYEITERQESLNVMLAAWDILNGYPGATYDEIGKINYSVGAAYHGLYDMARAKPYFKNAVEAYEKSKTTPKRVLSDAYNGLAITYWDLGKLDSAKINFEKAIEILGQSGLKSHERLFYLLSFQLNLALVLDSQGNLGEAIKISEAAAKSCRKIISESNDGDLVDRAKGLQTIIIANLGAFYHDVGFLSRALQLNEMAYQKKKEVYGGNHPRTITTLYQISQSHYSLLNYNESIKVGKKTLALLNNARSNQAVLKADVLNHLAKVYFAMDSVSMAEETFGRSNALFRQTFGDNINRNYQIHLRDYTNFLSSHGEHRKAERLALDAYNYNRNNGPRDFPLFKNMLNLGEVNLAAGDFEETLYWAELGNSFLKQKLLEADNKIDSLQIDFYRPNLLLLKNKAAHRLLIGKSEERLLPLLESISGAIAILEQRKHFITKTADVSTLITEYRKISEFGKLLCQELYQITGMNSYLDSLVALHESGIYHRIRERLNAKTHISYGSVPKKLLVRERAIKTKLQGSLDNGQESVEGFFSTVQEFNVFQDSLKRLHPAYYRLRYASITESLGNIQEKIPGHTTIIRYLFIDDCLYAYVANNQSQDLFSLQFDPKQIDLLSNYRTDVGTISKTLFDLYQQLWKPFEQSINTENIIIFPDRQLFNLGFGLLTPRRITSFKELANQSLLAKHNIAYNYSLLLLDDARQTLEFKNDFVAYAPIFDDRMKTAYEMAVSDSVNLDKTYLTLLPQPFSARIAKKFSKRFRGESFLNMNATKTVFAKTANEHKIIHIGTHAESNNISPELSRLVFAKNVSDPTDINDNYLYTYEIYDQNLNSNLAILTACETGKPTFQPGEGMISLAHAFNYAGSKSILTSLWQIDEQSSAQILEYFYGYLVDGLPKDNALRKAKLDYLKTAEGRTLHPQYWAGLILMGDTAPIALAPSLNWIWFLISAVLVLGIGILWLFGKRKARSAL